MWVHIHSSVQTDSKSDVVALHMNEISYSDCWTEKLSRADLLSRNGSDTTHAVSTKNVNIEVCTSPVYFDLAS